MPRLLFPVVPAVVLRIVPLVFLLVFLAGCTHAANVREPASSTANVALAPSPKEAIPNPEALSQWQDVTSYQSSNVDLKGLTRLSVDCSDPDLYPTHPQETTKLYHVFKRAQYDLRKLKADDEACAIGAKYQSARGYRVCQMADALNYVVLSDTFQDACGHFYRGFWEVLFLRRNDSMGTLLSQGRTVYPKPNADFDGEMVIGPTYSLQSTTFLFLTPLFPGDMAKIEKQREKAAENFRFNERTLLYEAP